MLHINRYPAWPNGARKKQSSSPSNWVEVEAVVYPTAAAPVAWTDLDLSPWVGAKSVWGLLQVRPASGNTYVYFRQNGDASDRNGIPVNSAGWGAPSALVLTDSDGVVEWYCIAATNEEITLSGYVDSVHLSDLALYSGAVPAGWSTLDAGAEIDAISVCQVRDLQTIAMAGKSHILRPRGDASNWETYDQYDWAWSDRLRNGALDRAGDLITVTDVDGLIDLNASAAGSSADINLRVFVPLGGGLYLPTPGSEVVFPYGASPTVETDLDLSAAVGAQKALVFMKAVNAQYVYCGFEKKGNPLTMPTTYSGVAFFRSVTAGTRAGLIVVPCDADGFVRWITGHSGGGLAEVGVTVLGYIPTL